MKNLIVFLTTILFVLFTTATYAQSYPNLYADGKGLGVSAFQLQKKVGSRWVRARKYERNQKYRFRLRFTNYFKRGNPHLGFNAFHHVGISITSIQVDLRIHAYGKWDENNQHHERQFILRCNRDGSCPDVIAPAESKWFTLPKTFTWYGPAASFSQYPVEIYTVHREITHTPQGHWRNITIQ